MAEAGEDGTGVAREPSRVETQLLSRAPAQPRPVRRWSRQK